MNRITTIIFTSLLGMNGVAYAQKSAGDKPTGYVPPLDCHGSFIPDTGDSGWFVPGETKTARFYIAGYRGNPYTFSWEIFKFGVGSPDVIVEPSSGEFTAQPGIFVQYLPDVQVTVPENTPAHDGTYISLAMYDADGRNGCTSGTPLGPRIVVRPSGEETTPIGWGDDILDVCRDESGAFEPCATLHKFQQRLLPLSADFEGRVVQEFGEAEDTCWFEGSDIPRITRVNGSKWRIGSENYWTAFEPDAPPHQAYDLVGWFPVAVRYYRKERAKRELPMPCGVTVTQKMRINWYDGYLSNFVDASFPPYVENQLYEGMNEDFVYSERAGHLMARRWP